MSTLATALPVIGAILAVLVQIGLLIWVALKTTGRPRTFGMSGLGLLIFGLLLQATWPLAAESLVRLDRTFVLLQTGWLVSDLIRLAGVVLLSIAVVLGRARPDAHQPPPGGPGQNLAYAPPPYSPTGYAPPAPPGYGPGPEGPRGY